MAKGKSAGTSQLGHDPFSKVKLEGPKRHHDDHGPTASVPGKGNKNAVPNQHWERGYNQWAPSPNMILTEGADFNAKTSRQRKTTHLMVNPEDH